MAVYDAAAGQVVRGKLERNAITYQDADFELGHLTGGVSQHRVSVLEEDAEVPIGEYFRDNSLHLDAALFCHKRP